MNSELVNAYNKTYGIFILDSTENGVIDSKKSRVALKWATRLFCLLQTGFSKFGRVGRISKDT